MRVCCLGHWFINKDKRNTGNYIEPLIVQHSNKLYKNILCRKTYHMLVCPLLFTWPSKTLIDEKGHCFYIVFSYIGESIEVLDIGLRNTRNPNAVHRVKPSEPTQPFLPTSLSNPTSPKRVWANLYTKGVSQSTLEISSLGVGAQNHVHGKRSSGNVGYNSYYTSPNHRVRSSSCSSQGAYGQEYSYLPRFHGRLPQMYGTPRMANSSIEPGDPRERGRSSAGSSNTSSSGPSPSHTPLIGGKIPPPNMLKDWGSMPNEGSPKYSSHDSSSLDEEEDMQREDECRRDNGKEFVARESLLRRSEAFRTQSSKRAPPSECDIGGIWGGRRMSEGSSKGRSQNDTDSSLLRSTPLKRSCHYRKIELQAEAPLFEQKEDEEESSDEDIASVVSDITGKYNSAFLPTSSTAGKSFHSLGRDPYHSPLSIPARLETYGRRRNYSGPPLSGRRSGGHGFHSAWSRERLEMGGTEYMGRSSGSSWNGSGLGLGSGSPFSSGSGQSSPHQPHSLSGRPPLVHEASSQRYHSLEDLERNHQEERANKYCQVTVGERDEGAMFGITATRAGIPNAKLDNILSKSQHSSVHSIADDIQSSTYENEIRKQGEREEHQQKNTKNHFPDNFDISPPAFDEFGTRFQLPARGSESFLYHSPEDTEPPIDEIIAPPMSFDHSAMSTVVNETIPEEEESQNSDNDHMESKPKSSTAVTTNRHSTESCDTGYTSGQSPGFSERNNLTTVNEFPQASAAEFPSTSEKNKEGTPSELSASMGSIQNSHSGYSIRHSQTSFASTDSIRFYVPFVFQKSGRAAKLGRSSSKTALFLHVCLVENSDHLIKVRLYNVYYNCVHSSTHFGDNCSKISSLYSEDITNHVFS